MSEKNILPIHRKNDAFLGSFYTILSASSFGTIGYFGVNIFRHGFTPENLLFWRFLIASILLAFYVWIKNKGKISFKFQDYVPSLCMGLLFYFTGALCLFYAIERIGSSIALVLFFAFPIFVAIISHTFKVEKLTWLTTVCIGSSFFGCWLLSQNSTLNSSTGSPSDSFKYGYFFALLAAFLYALYFFLSKKLLKTANRKDPLALSLAVLLGNVVGYTGTAVWTKSLVIPPFDFVWIHIFGIAVIGTILPVVFLFLGIEKIGPTRAAILSVFEPLVAVILGISLLGEPFGGMQVLGCFIILFSISFLQMEKIMLSKFSKRNKAVDF